MAREVFVLDAFALMALFQDEPGADRVQALIQQAQEGQADIFMAVVSLGEVAYGLEKRRGIDACVRALGAIDASPIIIVDVDRYLALQAAHLKASTNVGYLDCFVAALAQQLTATVLTGDSDFEHIPGLAVEWLPV